MLSVMAHGHGDVQTAVNIAQVAAAVDLDSDNRAPYFDLIEAALGEAARKAFEMLPETYQFQRPTYLRGRSEGKAEGNAEGKVEGKAEDKAEGKAEGEAGAVLAILDTRGISITEEQRQQILECTDLDRLNAWVRRAVTLTDVNELF